MIAIDQTDKTEKFIELHDFRNAPRQTRSALQPTDIGWNPNDGKKSTKKFYLIVFFVFL